MKKFSLAIEKGKRYLEANHISQYYFLVPEFIFKKEEIYTGVYNMVFESNGEIFFKQELNIDIDQKNILFTNSHEDPLVESEEYYFICGQLREEIIKSNYIEINCYFYKENKLLRKEVLKYNEISNLFLLHDWNSKIFLNHVTSEKNCIIRVHLGKENTQYHEEEFILSANKKFYFDKYLDNYEYVAVQCSYEESFDLEEKHILKGIKGIWNSSYYFLNEFFIPMIPFSKDYTRIKTCGFNKIENINELIIYYRDNPENTKKTFEMNDNFFVEYYKNYKTSAIGEIYSDKKSKIYHIDSQLCNGCNKRSECMQLVPSGLSESLFKKNMMVENFENCSINKIINKKE